MHSLSCAIVIFFGGSFLVVLLIRGNVVVGRPLCQILSCQFAQFSSLLQNVLSHRTSSKSRNRKNPLAILPISPEPAPANNVSVYDLFTLSDQTKPIQITTLNLKFVMVYFVRWIKNSYHSFLRSFLIILSILLKSFLFLILIFGPMFHGESAPSRADFKEVRLVSREF